MPERLRTFDLAASHHQIKKRIPLCDLCVFAVNANNFTLLIITYTNGKKGSNFPFPEGVAPKTFLFGHLLRCRLGGSR
jgi:hypothetical protein